MSREIKFRTWNKKLKCWGGGISINKYGVAASTLQRLDVKRRGDTYELMQYTGLKDKNGKEIYEGDIVRLIYSHDNGFKDSYSDDNEAITWSDDYARFNVGDFYDLGTVTAEQDYTVEIIGNIHENPELVK